MIVALRQPMTIAAFLAWEERQELRWEFNGFEPVAMTGGTRAHEIIGGNVLIAVQSRQVGRRCRAFGPTLKIEVAGRIRYPDVFVVCTPAGIEVEVPLAEFYTDVDLTEPQAA